MPEDPAARKLVESKIRAKKFDNKEKMRQQEEAIKKLKPALNCQLEQRRAFFEAVVPMQAAYRANSNTLASMESDAEELAALRSQHEATTRQLQEAQERRDGETQQLQEAQLKVEGERQVAARQDAALSTVQTWALSNDRIWPTPFVGTAGAHTYTSQLSLTPHRQTHTRAG